MIKRLTDRIYYMPHNEDTDRPSLGLICGNKYSLIVDSGNSPNHAEEFLSQIKSMDIPPLRYLAITHSHWDHVFGIKEMNLVTIANDRTKEMLDEMRKLRWDDISLGEYLASGRFTEFTINCIQKEIHQREGFAVGDVDIIYKDRITIVLFPG